MIYLIGGAPRVGKSILAQRLASRLKIGWISTDILYDVLRFKSDDAGKNEWNADPDAIAATAEWFFPYLQRFVWGVNSMAEHYVIEGVSILPAQAARLASEFPVRVVFLGCSNMSLERLDQYPGHSRGYAALPETLRHRIAFDAPQWSAFIQREAAQLGYRYVDTADAFLDRLEEAETALCPDS